MRAIDPDTGASFNDYTNASGGYTIEGLPVDSYRVQASDWEMSKYEWEFFQDTQDPAAATLVPPRRTRPSAASTSRWRPWRPSRSPGAEDLTGKVVDETGKPVVGAYVNAYSTPADYDNHPRSLESEVTNRQGVYVLDEVDGVPDDAVKVYANGFGPARRTASASTVPTWVTPTPGRPPRPSPPTPSPAPVLTSRW